ncbi:MAG: hypothetical protein NZ918_05525 [Aigarchaeota archaeon]|nr:hypothetical protein [Aigarchaeota archaeon]
MRKELESLGFYVLRSAGSHGIDLAAIKDGKVFLVECKAAFSHGAMAFLKQLSEKLGVKIFIALKKKEGIVFIDVCGGGVFSLGDLPIE